MAHQVTVKGQVTIPKRVREYLGIRPGSGVEFEVSPQGDVVLRKAGRGGKDARPRSRFGALRGTRAGALADFLVGAHAAVLQIPILTRDVTRFRAYFPTVRLVSPG